MPKEINLYGDRIVKCLTWKDLEKLGINSDDINWSNYGGSLHKTAFKDYDEKPEIIADLEMTWHNDWINQGGKDEGSCTLGNSLQLRVLPKRCKYPKYFDIALAPRVQGNISKANSSRNALKKLNNKLSTLFGEEIKATYNDGNMD
tara:strand:+ start:154 stop:591 length:438 start_codon:yes stop_codon:yes gene_type:complete